MNIIQSGNEIVDTVGRLNFSGNITPEAWFSTIVNEKGKANFTAINILAELVYGYRPAETRDEYTNTVTYRKKFAAEDFVQKSYKQLCEKFNISEKQAREALILLESLGVVKRHFRTIHTNMGCISNVMFLELIPSALEVLTFPQNNNTSPEDDPISLQGNTSFPTAKRILPQTETDDEHKGNTYTETNTKTNTKTETTTDVAKQLLSEYSLSDNDIETIVKTSNFDIKKIESAVESLKACRTTIKSVTGFLITAIRDNYTTKEHRAKNPGNSFLQHNYDFAAIERLLTAAP